MQRIRDRTKRDYAQRHHASYQARITLGELLGSLRRLLGRALGAPPSRLGAGGAGRRSVFACGAAIVGIKSGHGGVSRISGPLVSVRGTSVLPLRVDDVPSRLGTL